MHMIFCRYSYNDDLFLYGFFEDYNPKNSLRVPLVCNNDCSLSKDENGFLYIVYNSNPKKRTYLNIMLRDKLSNLGTNYSIISNILFIYIKLIRISNFSHIGNNVKITIYNKKSIKYLHEYDVII